jgi:hypothetical protein
MSTTTGRTAQHAAPDATPTRVLVQVTHHPRPEHRGDLLAAMRRITAASASVPGLEEVGAFAGETGDGVVAISVWSSAEAMQAGMGALLAAVGDVDMDPWERLPAEMLVMPQVA